MNKLSIQLWGESSPADYEFIGWRSDRQALLLLDPVGERRIVPLMWPDIGGATIGGLPQDDTPQSLRPMRLVPPPIREEEREAKALIEFAATHDLRSNAALAGIQTEFITYVCAQGCDGAQLPELWELEYGDALWPKLEDEKPLRSSLAVWRTAKRRERDARLAEAQQGPAAERDAEVASITAEYDAPLRRRASGTLVGGFLNLTLEALKQGHELLDAVLHQRWAREHGLDLKMMNEQRRAFDNLMAVTRRQLNMPPYQQIQNLCRARVRYVMAFDGPSKPCWLNECKPRPPQTRSEMDDFAKLRPGRRPHAATIFPRFAPPSAADIGNWPDLLGRKQIIQLLGCSKNAYAEKLTTLGIQSAVPESRRKQYRKADILAALHRASPAGTMRDNGPSGTSAG